MRSCTETENWILPQYEKFKRVLWGQRRFELTVVLMTVIVCVCLLDFSGLSASAGISRLLHCLVPSFRSFCSAAAVHRDYRLFCVQKPCLPSKWGFRGKKKKKIEKEKKNSTWKYHNVLKISSYSSGMFWEYVGSPFRIVIFPCVFSNSYLPTGHRGL